MLISLIKMWGELDKLKTNMKGPQLVWVPKTTFTID
jgi:hypothetical protein